MMRRPYMKLGPKSAAPSMKKPMPRIFDLILLEDHFPAVRQQDNEPLQTAVMKKIEELAIPEQERDNLAKAVAEVEKIFEELITSPGTFTACQIDKCHQVGSFKKGTLMKGEKTAELVVVLKTLPFIKTIEILANKVMESISKSDALMFGCGFLHGLTEDGFDIIGPPGRIQIHITTILQNLYKLDTSAHLPYRVLESNLNAIKQARWFEDNCQKDVIINVLRLLTYMRNVYKGFEALTPWMLDLLGNYSVMNTPNREPLSEGVAFKRSLQLLSAGLFLSKSSGIPDPCNDYKRVYLTLSMEEQDLICLTAQNLLRLLSHGGPNVVLSGKPNIVHTTTMWKGVVVNPLDKAYEKPPELEQMEVSQEIAAIA